MTDAELMQVIIKVVYPDFHGDSESERIANKIYVSETSYGMPFELILDEMQFNRFDKISKFRIMFYYQLLATCNRVKDGMKIGSYEWATKVHLNREQLKKIWENKLDS